ncbi:MAG: N5-glutamine methyltransferase family protein [Bdellovibrionota bacterium]
MAFSRDVPTSFGEALQLAKRLLSANADLVKRSLIDTESEQIVSAAYRLATGKTLARVELFTRVHDAFPHVAGEKVIIIAMGRASGKPLQHLLGTQIFLDHEYEVGPDVLVPRPETELLATIAIETLAKEPPQLGIEIGLGSGVLSIELLSRFPALTMTASELTEVARMRAAGNALRILERDAHRLKIVAVQDPETVWDPFDAGAGADFLISNPPYLTPADPVDPEVHTHEPQTALYAPTHDPLHFYREIASGMDRYLRPGAWVFLELAPERAAEVWELFEEKSREAEILKDLAGRDRILKAKV